MLKKLFVALLSLFLVFPTLADDAVKKEEVHRIVISGTIDTASETSLASALDDAKKAEAKSLYIVFNTPGGSVFSGIEMERMILESGLPTVCEAKVAISMGAYLFESPACGIRLVRPDSLILFHGVSGGQSTQRQGESANHLSALKAIDHMLSVVISARIGMPVDEYEKLTGRYDREWWVNGDKAVALHVADKMLPLHKPVKKSVKKLVKKK